MKNEAQRQTLIEENPIPEVYRQIIHDHNFTCVFSCKVGRRASTGQMGITSSNLDPQTFKDAEQKAIVRGDPELVLKRGAATFVYRLITKTASARLYRVAAHLADFARGKY
ncbi:MAG: hypothetical protein HZC54_18750 [Verrucomicrobia bacterium]|nr:hypothetical protein [Verrucomicrobiota bacterium]